MVQGSYPLLCLTSVSRGWACWAHYVCTRLQARRPAPLLFTGWLISSSSSTSQQGRDAKEPTAFVFAPCTTHWRLGGAQWVLCFPYTQRENKMLCSWQKTFSRCGYEAWSCILSCDLAQLCHSHGSERLAKSLVFLGWTFMDTKTRRIFPRVSKSMWL